MLQHPRSKIAIQIDVNLLIELENMDAKILKERLMADHKIIYFPAHSRFFNPFNEKFKQMLEAGLFGLFIQEAIDSINKTVQEPAEPFKVLTLEELEAGFVICMIPLMFATIIFCLEMFGNLILK